MVDRDDMKDYNYKRISRLIRVLYGVTLGLVVAMIVLCECQLIPVEGMLVGLDEGTEYVVEVAMLFVVGIGILAALKGYDWMLRRRVSRAEGVHKENMYVVINNARIVLLGFLMLLGVFFYYGTLENWGMYYGLASFVVSFFCLPSAEGVEVELELASVTCS